MFGRSREGAWIEIFSHQPTQTFHLRRSREGAWIEIRILVAKGFVKLVAPVRERGLKS